MSHDPARRVRELERDNDVLRRAISLLHRIAKLVRTPLELEATCYAILTGATAGVGLGLNRAMLFLVDDRDRSRLEGVAAVGPRDLDEAERVWRSVASEAMDLDALYLHGLRQRDNPGPLDTRVHGIAVPVDGDSPVALALRRAEVVRGAGTDDLDGLLHLRTCIATPLRGRQQLNGVLYADNCFTGRRPDPDVELVFSLLGDHAGHAIDTARSYERVARAARTDTLTGLGHHGAMMEGVRRTVERARARGAPLGLLMIDLDDFKRVNDTLGHLAGDALLAAVADRLRGALRSGATPYRYGGEEFAVILPDHDEEELARAAERIRLALGELPYGIAADRSVQVTCSIGFASLGGDEDDARALLARADAALLDAKRRGKNRVAAA